MSHDEERWKLFRGIPRSHLDLPGFAHGLSRSGGHWFDITISVVPGEQDPLEALDKVFAKLRETLVSEKPGVEYFAVDLRVTSNTRSRAPLTSATTQF